MASRIVAIDGVPAAVGSRRLALMSETRVEDGVVRSSGSAMKMLSWTYQLRQSELGYGTYPIG
jgi:hypothetical protein